MFSVKKIENGIIPINAFYAAAVSVMKREEATILMKIKAQDTRTEKDLFENIKFHLSNESKNKINNVDKNNIGENSDENAIDENKINENSLKLRTISFLHFTLSEQRKILISSIGHRSLLTLPEKSKTVENDRKIELNSKIFSENSSNLEISKFEEGCNISEKSCNKNNKSNDTINSKKEKKSIDLNIEKDSGPDSRSSMNILVCCKFLLQVNLVANTFNLLLFVAIIFLTSYYYCYYYYSSICLLMRLISNNIIIQIFILRFIVLKSFLLFLFLLFLGSNIHH